jgi:hypothetical protein
LYQIEINGHQRESLMFTLPWLKKKTPAPDVLKVGDVYFWQEQNGDVEQKLKAQLLRVPAFKFVTEAYLMRVRYPGSEVEQVALCLVAEADRHQQIVEDVLKTFRPMFKSTESLDILFLTEDQCQRIREVTGPFHRKDAG